jgi:hypothetical protein
MAIFELMGHNDSVSIADLLESDKLSHEQKSSE